MRFSAGLLPLSRMAHRVIEFTRTEISGRIEEINIMSISPYCAYYDTEGNDNQDTARYGFHSYHLTL